ncbi:hypothetical protein ACKC9G_08035 [Pokkaliibacter sp. CJK22405]|uniref:hypothetical protein n=1 Tax=Pokkaliibacter sp. CJK22405 TaxID=3384615 RepID=UPI003984EE28
MKDEGKSQVVSVRLNPEQLEFLSQLKGELELDMETEVSMATVIRRILSRYISKHKGSQKRGGGPARVEALEQRLTELEARLAALESAQH